MTEDRRRLTYPARGPRDVSPPPSTSPEIFLLEAPDAMVHLRGCIESGDF